jgi:hypothetical protein
MKEMMRSLGKYVRKKKREVNVEDGNDGVLKEEE